jgi:hypothetical protein
MATGRRASSAARKSSAKDASNKQPRDKDESKVSGVESRSDAGAVDAEGVEVEDMVPPAEPRDRESADMRASEGQKPSDEMRESDGEKKSEDARAPEGQKPSDEMRASDSADADREPDDDNPDDQDEGSSKTELTYYKDTKPIIDAKCGICHMPGGIAPIAFTTYAEVKPFVALMRIDIEGGVMPPWLPSDPPGKFVGDRRLTPEQKSTFLKWIEGGALEGNPADEPPSLPLEGRRSLAQVDQSLHMMQPYAPQLGADEYRCFVLDWPLDVTKYVTALDIVPGNRQLVHHAILYYVEPEQVQAVRDRDAEDTGQGFPCFGGVGKAAWLTSYEPGGHADEIPGEVGFAIVPGSVMVLQIHYNTLNNMGTDTSRIDFTLKDQVERVGNVQLIMDPRWPAGSMRIPMGQADVVHTYTGRAASLSTTMNYEIFWVDMHMHALGSAGRIGIVRGNGELEELVNIPAWDFGWQETYMLREPVTLFPDDSLYVECHFDNTAENQIFVNDVRLPPRDVAWGEKTTDEMCLGNVLIAPVLPLPTGEDSAAP